ncbi:MAG: hypothetical protein JSS32_08475 [Verrucomicrobia bacterium]|nr:hypothetical protein [Verrucomicrobiota bacterium]
MKKWSFMCAAALGTLLIEPGPALRSGLSFPLTWKKQFVYHTLNPKKITLEQAQKRPILMIHGNYDRQTAYLPLAKKLKTADVGPIYTISLPSGAITKTDYQLLSEKIAEIKAQYSEHGVDDPKIDLIGHSRGGHLAQSITWAEELADGDRYYRRERAQDIGKVITLGSVLDQEEIDRYRKIDPNFDDQTFEIVGKYDILVTAPSLVKTGIAVDTGHLGILHSDTAHRQIIEWLKA